MLFSFDRCGFPFVPLAQLWLEVQLFPVTKVQFERFLAEPDTYGDDWYDAVLQYHPRCSYRGFAVGERERLFLGGVLPEEALAYARWLGDGYDLPTVEEWRQIALALAGLPAPSAAELADWPAGPAPTIAEQMLTQLPARTLLNLSLMRGGLVEWVRDGAPLTPSPSPTNRSPDAAFTVGNSANTDGAAWAGLGAPRPEFKAHLWDPLRDVIRPVRVGERVGYVGFRLVRRI